jgi:aryl-alcohol dehydrogenase-like predicted oxidoreductase
VAVVNKTINLGGREIARMGLGTNRLTETPPNIDFIREVAAAGIGLIDTAHLYTGGASERTIGAALGGNEDICVATKGGYRPGEGDPDVLRSQIEQSLERLQTDQIFLYYLHRIDPETPLETTLTVLADYQQRGAIANVGLSEVGVDEIERARSVVPIAAVQNNYNVDERRWDDVVDYCTELGIVFVPFYPLHASSSALSEVAQAHGATPSQIALAWLLHRSPAMLPIPGTLSIAHVRENVAALDIVLSDDDLAALD